MIEIKRINQNNYCSLGLRSANKSIKYELVIQKSTQQTTLDLRLSRIIEQFQNVVDYSNMEILETFRQLSRSVSGGIQVGPLDPNDNTKDPNNYRFEDPWDYLNIIVWEDGIEAKKLIEGGISEALLSGISLNKLLLSIKCRRCNITNQVSLMNHLLGLGWCSCYVDRQTIKARPIEKIILYFNVVHGDRYNYSIFDYRRNTLSSFFRCPKCKSLNQNDVFVSTPKQHIRGEGCPKCGIERRSRIRSSDWSSQVFPTFIDIHGDLYEYDEFEYLNNRTHSIIKCKRCRDLGREYRFKQCSDMHIRGNGCPKCGIERGAKLRLNNWENQVIPSFTDTHGDLYEYDEFEYVNCDIPSTIKCKRCRELGREYHFKQSAWSHKSGQGCPKCANEINSKNRILDWSSQVLPEFIRTHGDLYEYDEFGYIDGETKGIVKCKRCRDLNREYRFKQSPVKHKGGRGCPSCANSGFSQSKPGILYILKLDTPEGYLYKVGITNRSVAIRYQERNKFKKSDLCQYSYDVILEKHFQVGEEARYQERLLLNQYRDYRYNGNLKLFIHTGNTEVLTVNPLEEFPSLEG